MVTNAISLSSFPENIFNFTKAFFDADSYCCIESIQIEVFEIQQNVCSWSLLKHMYKWFVWLDMWWIQLAIDISGKHKRSTVICNPVNTIVPNKTDHEIYWFVKEWSSKTQGWNMMCLWNTMPQVGTSRVTGSRSKGAQQWCHVIVLDSRKIDTKY